MATRGDSPISPRRYRRANWVSSKEIHRLTSSGSAQSPNSPEELGLSLELVPPLTKDKNWYKKVSCCHLESAMGDGQGVIVCLGTDNYHQQFAEMFEVSTYPAFALITCHHVISGRSNLKNWKLVISGMEMKKFAVKLDDRKFDACRSCCGENGVLGKEEHPNKVCPFGADFTVLILTKEFANEMLKNRDLLFPVIMPLDMQSLKAALQSKRFYLFKRDKASGIIRTIEVNIHKRAPPSDDEESIEGQIEAYEKMCKLTYDKNPEVIGGDSGAGIFLTEGSERLLLGLHKSTEADEDTHTGIAIHAIFHAIASETSEMYLECIRKNTHSNSEDV